jgi:hypothetical protein
LSDTTNAATEIVADVAEEVAEQATHVAEVSRGLSGRNFSFGFGGLVVGLGVGATVGYIFAKRQLEAKYSAIAAEEAAEAREHYYAKSVALENVKDKPDLADIVREQGYSVDPEPSQPPMAVTPPSAVVEAAQEEEVVGAEPEAETAEPVVHQNTFQQFGDAARPEHEWDWHKERSRRSPLKPYVIHIDEREERADVYECVMFTYFEEDDILCNERDEVVGKEDRDRIIGEANLNRFGHGSGDATVVYIRNDQLEMDVEVNLSPNSYAEEVHGFEPEIRHSDQRFRSRRGRASFDDE